MLKRNSVTNADSRIKTFKQQCAIPLLIGCITTFPVFSVQSSINNGIEVYPPNWWVGMQNSNVELMVYGDDVADDTVSIAKGDVIIKTKKDKKRLKENRRLRLRKYNSKETAYPK